MPDAFTKRKRSDVMSRIRRGGNRDTELALAKLFRREGITGWRRQRLIVVRRSRREEAYTMKRKAGTSEREPIRASSRRLLQVKPDFVFLKLRLAMFVDGCFWHACPLHVTKPRHHAVFWRKKFAANRARDRKVTRTLRAAGWRVLRIWEHELARKREARLVARLRRTLALQDGVAPVSPCGEASAWRAQASAHASPRFRTTRTVEAALFNA